jgi:protein-S-isoprenylcysteine O-methyltransferase Ste14
MSPDVTAPGREAWIRSALFVPVLALTLFGPPGTLRFWQGWLYGFVFVSGTTAITIYFLKHDPKLIERRMRAGPGAEEVPAQKIIKTITLVAFALLLALPGLDYRRHWSAVPAWLVFAANAGVTLSFYIFFIVLKQNSYAASTIRVEANQPVISTGVYAIVSTHFTRGALLLLVFTPLALESYWSLLILIPTVPVLIWRLLDEERLLKQNLPSYTDYCRTKRFRLIPRIW